MKKQSGRSRMDESLGERRGKESKKKQSYKARRDESDAMVRSKKLSKPGKMVSGKKFSKALEDYDEKIGMESNHPALKPADISGAFSRAQKKMGYSKKPRVKPNRVGKGK